jgi:hypothetical protein
MLPVRHLIIHHRVKMRVHLGQLADSTGEAVLMRLTDFCLIVPPLVLTLALSTRCGVFPVNAGIALWLPRSRNGFHHVWHRQYPRCRQRVTAWHCAAHAAAIGVGSPRSRAVSRALSTGGFPSLAPGVPAPCGVFPVLCHVLCHGTARRTLAA